MIRKIKTAILSLFIILPTYSYASIEINKDKFIFIESKNLEIIEIKNNTTNDYFIQSWISHYDESNETELPFMITPPLFKIEKDENYSLKIFKTDEIEKKDRETLYRINIKRIPLLSNSDENKNLLHISMNSVYNLIYRPVSIERDAKDAYKRIEFLKNKNNEFIVNNPTPYFITLLNVNSEGVVLIEKSKTIPPFKKYNTKKTIKKDGLIKWKTIDQYGVEINATNKAIINED
ncbi:fimbrial chaperone BcfG [Proteus vulgaris]|uniref:fimbrial biogenesis chaperone n=1 Tax=Proteus TaxID=583 RepID=UPI0018C7FEBC|nr:MULTISPECIES: molecular chaperone [Proteus]MBG2709807.1 molecular chaperone [Proteus mirabilis]MBG2765868.1 molecular chaperone [Proteus mirabilis]GLX64837.1 fimbrial chaperone BcfG [Proteus vulgaris]